MLGKPKNKVLDSMDDVALPSQIAMKMALDALSHVDDLDLNQVTVMNVALTPNREQTAVDLYFENSLETMHLNMLRAVNPNFVIVANSSDTSQHSTHVNHVTVRIPNGLIQQQWTHSIAPSEKDADATAESAPPVPAAFAAEFDKNTGKNFGQMVQITLAEVNEVMNS